MHHSEKHRSQAARHVEEGERRVACQEIRIEQSRAKGYSTSLSEAIL
jgi:hypothetical protein